MYIENGQWSPFKGTKVIVCDIISKHLQKKLLKTVTGWLPNGTISAMLVSIV